MLDVVVGQDLFKSSAQTLVNTVNTVGVMGKGIAKRFADRFPDMLADYEDRCATGQVRLGEPYLYVRSQLPWILNFPTKAHWRASSEIGPIIEGLDFVQQHLVTWGVESLAVPPLGCGHGGLEWRAVGPTYADMLRSFPIAVTLFAPFPIPGLTASTGMPRLFEDSGDVAAAAVPRSLVPTDWLSVVRIFAEELGDRALSRLELARIAASISAAGYDLGLLLDPIDDPAGASAFRAVVAKLLSNGLLSEERRGRRVWYSPGPAARHLPPAVGEDADRIHLLIMEGVDAGG